MSELRREEFLQHMAFLREDTTEIKDHLKELNSRTGKNEQEIAILKDWRSRVARAQTDTDDVKGAITARDVKVAAWALTGVGGLVGFVWKVIPVIFKVFQP